MSEEFLLYVMYVAEFFWWLARWIVGIGVVATLAWLSVWWPFNKARQLRLNPWNGARTPRKTAVAYVLRTVATLLIALYTILLFSFIGYSNGERAPRVPAEKAQQR